MGTPSTGFGKFVGALSCVGGVMVIAGAAAMMSVHFRDRWLQEKAKAGFRRRFAEFPELQREQDEIEEMLAELQSSMDMLLAKLADVTVRMDDGNRSTSMVPLLKSMNSHGMALLNGMSAYIYDLLFETMALDAEQEHLNRQPSFSAFVSQNAVED